MLPAVWNLHRVPGWQQLSTVGLVGLARNPSKLTVWCIFSGSGLAGEFNAQGWRKSACSVQAAAALPL